MLGNKKRKRKGGCYSTLKKRKEAILHHVPFSTKMRNIPQSYFRKISKTRDERPEEKLSCWSHHPFVIKQVLRKLILAKKDRSPAVQNFFLSSRNTQASRRVHLRQLWFCISANSLFLIEQVCIAIAVVWPQSKVEQTQVVTISILTTMMRMTMVRMTMMTQRLRWHWYLWWSKEKSKALVQSGKSNRSQRSRVGTLDTSGFFWLCKSLASENKEYYHG